MSADVGTQDALARAVGEIKGYVDSKLGEFGVRADELAKNYEKRSAETDDRVSKALADAVSKDEAKKLLDDVLKEAARIKGETPNLVGDFDMARIRRGATDAATPGEAKAIYEEFLTSKPANETVARFHELSTKLTLLRTIMRRYDPDWEPSRAQNNVARAWFREYQAIQKSTFTDSFLERAFDTQSTNDGPDWIPSFMSADLIRYIEVRGGLIPLLRSVAMPGKVYDLPFTSTAGIGHVFSERTASPSAAYNYTTRELYTNGSGPIDNNRLDAITIRAFIVASQQVIEDSIIPMIDFMATDTADAIRRAIEDAIINGDGTTTHFDTLPSISYTPDGAGGVHNRTAWDGFRLNINTNGANARVALAATSYGSLAPFANVLAKMGRYAAEGPGNLAWVASPLAYFKLLALPEFATVEKIGARATVVTGQVGSILGSPLVLSEFVRQDLDANGVASTTTNNTTEIIVFHRPSWWIGNYRGISTEPERLPGWDQNVIWARWRGDVIKLWAVGQISEAALVDIRP